MLHIKKIILKSLDDKYTPQFVFSGTCTKKSAVDVLSPSDLIGCKDGYINIGCGVSGKNREIVIYLKGWEDVNPADVVAFRLYILKSGRMVLKPSVKKSDENLFVVAYEYRQTNATSRKYFVKYLNDGKYYTFQYHNWWRGDFVITKDEEVKLRYSYFRHTGRGNNYENQETIKI